VRISRCVATSSRLPALRSSSTPQKLTSSGVVRIPPVNSGDVSDYGAQGTANNEKEVFVTVRASVVLE